MPVELYLSSSQYDINGYEIIRVGEMVVNLHPQSHRDGGTPTG